jgi:hypothetical protein
MAKDTETKALSTPPYIPFATFAAFIEAMKNTTIPPRIDSSVTPTMSGQMRGALTSCLAFLELMDKDRAVTSRLKPLVDAYGTDEWRPALSTVIGPSYLRIVGGLDLARATGGQLTEAFRDKGGVDGQVLEKCVRFYLAAMDAAGLPYSPHFKTRGATSIRKSNGSKPKARKPKGGTPLSGDDPERADPPPLAVDGLVPFVVPFPDKAAAKFYIPKNITEDDWTLIDTIGRAYVKRAMTKAG